MALCPIVFALTVADVAASAFLQAQDVLIYNSYPRLDTGSVCGSALHRILLYGVCQRQSDSADCRAKRAA